MKREDIKEIQGRGSEYKAWTGERIVELSKNERDELCRLAFKATEPGMVMIPREVLFAWIEHLKSRQPSFVRDEMLAAAQEDQP